MADIDRLLNPVIETQHPKSEAAVSNKGMTSKPDDGPEGTARKRQKVCKDAAVFIYGPIVGECRYPPHEYQDDSLLAHHELFDLYPMGEIADYPRHIPYCSEKKAFWDKTGRQSLEVFQYQFKAPGDSTVYSMLWDYNIGLVRTTPLFKCTGHSKTTPAKMLNRNPGLREICHSITGGALVAQGYWVPFDAAKAVAATFCWSIRYALTPVFGVDFPLLCFHPDDPKYGDMTIDPSITQQCKKQSEAFRRIEEEVLSSRESSIAGGSKVFTQVTPATPAESSVVSSYDSRSKATTPSRDSNRSKTSLDERSPLASPLSSSSSYRTMIETPRSANSPQHASPLHRPWTIQRQHHPHTTFEPQERSDADPKSPANPRTDERLRDEGRLSIMLDSAHASTTGRDHSEHQVLEQYLEQYPGRSVEDLEAAYLLCYFKMYGGREYQHALPQQSPPPPPPPSLSSSPSRSPTPMQPSKEPEPDTRATDIDTNGRKRRASM